MMEFPGNIYYSRDHEWLRPEGDTALVGITAFAAGELGDVVYVEVDTVGRSLAANEVFGSIEAVKTVSDLFLPVAGRILEVNPLLADRPELVNTDPYGEGWLVRVQLEGEIGLMRADAYRELVGHSI